MRQHSVHRPISQLDATAQPMPGFRTKLLVYVSFSPSINTQSLGCTPAGPVHTFMTLQPDNPGYDQIFTILQASKTAGKTVKIRVIYQVRTARSTTLSPLRSQEAQRVPPSIQPEGGGARYARMTRDIVKCHRINQKKRRIGLFGHGSRAWCLLPESSARSPGLFHPDTPNRHTGVRFAAVNCPGNTKVDFQALVFTTTESAWNIVESLIYHFFQLNNELMNSSRWGINNRRYGRPPYFVAQLCVHYQLEVSPLSALTVNLPSLRFYAYSLQSCLR